MSLFLHACSVLLPVVYLLLVLVYAMEFAGPRAPHPHKLRHAITGVLLLLHGAWLWGHWTSVGHLPASDPWMLPTLIAFSLMAIYLPVEWMSGTPQTGSFVVGLAFILQLVSSVLVSETPIISEHMTDAAFALHVGMSILALSALMLSGFYGWLYLLLLRQMKRHVFGVLFQKLPNLDSLSRLNRGTATGGFILLTLGLNLAFAWAHSDEATEVNYLDPKILVVLVTWIFFGLIAASRWIRMLSGRRAAIFALAGLTLVFLTIIMASVPLGSLHGFAK